MYRGVILAIVAIIGFSMIGTGYLSGNDNDNDGGWFKKLWGGDNNWFKKYWDDFDFKKFTGFMNSGGGDSDDDDDDKCDCEDRKKDHKKHYDDFDKYYKNNKNKMDKGDHSKFMKDYENYMDRAGTYMDKSDYKMFMDYHEKILKENKNSYSSSDYKHSSDKHEKYSKDYPKHDDHCKCVPDRDDDDPMIDHAIINFNIVQKEKKDHDTNEIYYQNVIDECIFETAVDFAPLCIKCVFLKKDGNTETIVAKGEIRELGQSYTANTEIPILMSPVPWTDPYTPAANDVQNVDKVELTLCGEKCVPMFLDFKDSQLKHGARQSAINSVLAPMGITVSGTGNNGNNEVIIFDADKTGTADPDLQVKNGFHLLILPETGYKDTSPADGYIDSPNDAAAGGTITITLPTPKYLKSFVLVDHENDKNAVAKAYSDQAGLNLVKSVTLPITGDGKYTTVHMNAANVQRLDVTYKDSGGITNFDFRCAPPEQNCECEKPDKFTVKYTGPAFDKVVISKNGKDPVTLNGPFPNNEIMVDAKALGFKNGKVYSETTYNFMKSWKSIGTISIHTSCSQPLYEGQMFFYHKDKSDQIKLTVVSGTLNGKPSIPDASCPVPPEKCDCDDRHEYYEKYYNNHKKHYDDNKNKYKSADYKNYMDEHMKYLDSYGKYMVKADYKMHTDYFKKFIDDNKSKFSSSDYKKYSDMHKKYSDDYKNHSDKCKCDDDHDGKEHHDDDDDDGKSDKDKYKYGKDHDDDNNKHDDDDDD